MPLTELPGITPSAELRQQLADEGRPVLLAFSGGKDCVAAWIALRDAGVKVVPYHMQPVPGLAFMDDTIAGFEDHFQTPIVRLPHPAFLAWLRDHTYQPPERFIPLAACRIETPDYADALAWLKEEKGLAPDTWICDGVRANDSLIRRINTMKGGAVNPEDRKMRAVWDWDKAMVMDAINRDGIRLPVDYQWFGRSFDGIDYRFLKPLADYAPADYARVLEWFPLAGLGLLREDLAAKTGPKTTASRYSADEAERDQSARDRIAAERRRHSEATESEYWAALCFRTAADADRFDQQLAGLGAVPAGTEGPEARYFPGPALERVFPAPAKPDQAKRARLATAAYKAAKVPNPRVANPLDELPETGSLAEDSRLELEAIKTAITAPPAENTPDVRDSPHWRAVYWRTRKDKRAWLATRGLLPLGEKYVNGHAAARILGLEGWG